MLITLNNTSEIKNEIILTEEHAHYKPDALEVKLIFEDTFQSSNETEKIIHQIYCSLEKNGYEVLEEKEVGKYRKLLLSCGDGLTCFERIQDIEFALSSNEIDIMKNLKNYISVPFELTICYFGVN